MDHFHLRLAGIVWETVLETPTRLVDLAHFRQALAWKTRAYEIPFVEGAEDAAINEVIMQVPEGPDGLCMLRPAYYPMTFVYDRLAAARGNFVSFLEMDAIREHMTPCWPYDRVPANALCAGIEFLVHLNIAESEGMGYATRARLIPSA